MYKISKIILQQFVLSEVAFRFRQKIPESISGSLIYNSVSRILYETFSQDYNIPCLFFRKIEAYNGKYRFLTGINAFWVVPNNKPTIDTTN